LETSVSEALLPLSSGLKYVKECIQCLPRDVLRNVGHQPPAYTVQQPRRPRPGITHPVGEKTVLATRKLNCVFSVYKPVAAVVKKNIIKNTVHVQLNQLKPFVNLHTTR
jgi:hypothetical protein